MQHEKRTQVEGFFYLKLLTVNILYRITPYILRRDISFISEKLDQLKQMFSCFQKFVVKELVKTPQRCKGQPKPILRLIPLRLNGFDETMNKGN